MWTMAELEGTTPCSACTPDTFGDGSHNRKGGKWHNKFERIYLPKGMFITNSVGNLEHKETGSDNYREYEL